MNTFTGWASPLNTVIRTTGLSGVQNQVAGPFPGVLCQVYNAGTIVPATIYNSFSSLIDNPFFVSSDGSFIFSGTANTYDLVFSTSRPPSVNPSPVVSNITVTGIAEIDGLVNAPTQLNLGAAGTTHVSITDASVTSDLSVYTTVPMVPLGGFVATKVQGGSLTAQTYYLSVVGVTPSGGEGPIAEDIYATHEISATITVGDVSNGLRSLNVAFTGASNYVSYRVYYGVVSGSYTQYVGCTSSPGVLTLPPSGAPTGLACTLVAQESSLRSQSYYLKVVGVFGSGATSGRTVQIDPHQVIIGISAAQDQAVAISSSWDSLAGVDHYELYISSDNDGGSRQFNNYVNVGNVTSFVYTGQPLSFTPMWGNDDYQTASEFRVGSLRSTSRYRSSFAGDIILAGDYGVEVQTIYERPALLNQAAYAGISIRHAGIVDWEIGQQSQHTDGSDWSADGNHVSFRSYKSPITDVLIIDADGVKSTLQYFSAHGTNTSPGYAFADGGESSGWSFATSPARMSGVIGGVELSRLAAAEALFLVDVNAPSIRGNAVTVSNLPASPVEGMLVGVTDSMTATWGATITGSGGNHVLAYYNGSAWTVAGK